jgi:hypothetical protein
LRKPNKPLAEWHLLKPQEREVTLVSS